MDEVKKVFFDPSLESLKLPVRSDGMPNLNDVQGFIELNGFSTLDEMLSTYKETTTGLCSRIMLESAISSKKSGIAFKIAALLHDENISVKDAISILDLAKKKIKGSKFTL